MQFSLRHLFVPAILLGFASSDAKASTVSVYLSRPGNQTSTMSFSSGSGLLTETFDGLNGAYSSYNSTLGTYNGAMLVQPADQYGGANGTSYMTFGSQNGSNAPVSLSLNTQANYFGFWWSAGDGFNGVSFYSGDTKLSRFSTGDFTNALANGKVTAVDGSQYNSSAYYCNPNNPSQDCYEPFAYINVIVSGGSFDKLVFDNSDVAWTGFESDNHSVAYGTPVLPTSFVSVASEVVATPEPGTVPLVLAGCLLLACAAVRRKKPAEEANK